MNNHKKIQKINLKNVDLKFPLKFFKTSKNV